MSGGEGGGRGGMQLKWPPFVLATRYIEIVVPLPIRLARCWNKWNARSACRSSHSPNSLRCFDWFIFVSVYTGWITVTKHSQQTEWNQSFAIVCNHFHPSIIHLRNVSSSSANSPPLSGFSSISTSHMKTFFCFFKLCLVVVFNDYFNAISKLNARSFPSLQVSGNACNNLKLIMSIRHQIFLMPIHVRAFKWLAIFLLFFKRRNSEKAFGRSTCRGKIAK